MRTTQANRRPQVARVVGRLQTLPVLRRYPRVYVGSALKAWRDRADLASVRAFVVFVGHPRSGHSLVGSLLDAHPSMVVAHELDVLRFLAAGYRREQLFSLVVDRSQANAGAGRTSWGYSYAVPGQWQGRYRTLEVVGDKRGRLTTARLAEDPELLDRLAATVRVPVRVVQVVRNPYDNIATMFTRGKHTLEQQVDTWFALSATVEAVERRLEPGQLHRLHLEDLVDDPRRELRALCAFLDVPADDDYLDACASIVFPSPHATRATVPWTPELLAAVAERSVAHPWLARYAYDEPGS